MDGLLILDKPVGATSADVVRQVKRVLRCKTGHLGTLDPFASGVLPVCIGEGTKIAQFLNGADKEYSGMIQLGSATDTGDPSGTVTERSPLPSLDDTALHLAGQAFLGEIQQVPPMYSALKHQGTPLYKLARRGVSIEREARTVHIKALELALVAEDQIVFSVSCSKGTYVRVLAQDLAVALGTVGHLASLRRTRFGTFGIERAMSVESLDSARSQLVSLRESLADLREMAVDVNGAQRARQGYEPLLAALPLGAPNEVAKLLGPAGELAAVVEMEGQRRWRFVRVFAAESIPTS